MDSWRIWLAIVLLVDAGIGLLGLSRFASVVPARILVRVALAEAVAAVGLAIWHFAK